MDFVYRRQRKERRNGYKFYEEILPEMNSVCPICNKSLDIQGIKDYIQFQKTRRNLDYSGKRIIRKHIDVTIDHIKPIARGGDNDVSNIQLVHRQCNTIKGDKDFPHR